jgi:pimeloyl-ACP methyl ester carboxylesterase
VEGLAYDIDGTGVPVVLLHGLTFNRRTWRPIVERLGASVRGQIDGDAAHRASVRSIAIDLPAHGDSGGTPGALDAVVAQLRELLEAVEVEAPIVVGHSMSGAFACLYAATYPTLGVAVIDNGPDIRPFAQLARHLEPVLRGPGFADAWQAFEASLGIERLPEPMRALVLANHDVKQDVVLGYWETMLQTDPSELQAWIDATFSKITVPFLGVFGRPVTDAERERLDRLPDLQIEEWVGDGHFVHLVDPDRFAGRLRTFVEHCAAPARPHQRHAPIMRGVPGS